MKAVDIPAPFPIPFGADAVSSNIRPIPEASQIGIENGAASLTDGFPPDCFTPVSAGGTPPFGQDFNGVMFQSTSWDQWFSIGGPIKYSATMSTAIGGYPKGALVASAVTFGLFWLCLVDDNVTDPDAAGAGWQAGSFQGTFSTGDWKGSFKLSEPGWVVMNDGSIGNTGSGATTLADPTALALFTLLYGNVVDAWAPIQTSVGGATTRGAQGTAAAAWAAGCRLVLPRALGRAMASAGAISGGTARALGQNLGEETHLMTLAELVAHHHTVTGVSNSVPAGSVGSAALASGSANTSDTGGSTPFNVMQPTLCSNILLKL